METLDQGTALVFTMKGMKNMKAQEPQKTKHSQLLDSKAR